MDQDVILRVKQLSKSFLGVRALDKVDLEVKRGEVHAVIGENGAGKSTLMNVILGDLPRDEGEIIFKGKPVIFKSPSDAISAGISMIHQEISLIPTLSVMENIWLHREAPFMTAGLISNKKRADATRKLLREELHLEIDETALVSTLTVAQCQLVELARAVSCNSDVIIMDEPTSSLSDKEVDILFRIIREMTAKGVAVILITHKLEELFTICERVSVYRDGHYIGTKKCSETDRDELVKMIIGREMTDQYPAINAMQGDTILKVKNLSGDKFSDVNFELHRGEILGFAGLVGAGRSEIMRALFGIDKAYGGEVEIEGKAVYIKSPKDAVALGMAMVTEDRRDYGIIGTASVKTNISLAALGRFCSKLSMIKKKEETKAVNKMIKDMTVKVADAAMPVTSLSGGNQQKVILGRWLLTAPKILILDEPTRGIDVGAKSEIYNIMNELAKQGMAIIMVSSEMPEILGLCSRIMVVREGRIVLETSGEEATQEKIGQYALG